MNLLITFAEVAIWALVCTVAAPKSEWRFWLIVVAGIAFNLAGVAEGIFRQKAIDASTPILLNSQVPQ